MSPIYCVQFLLFSTCIHLFTIFTYVLYYGDLISSFVELHAEYDYIIVGAGSAGSLIAHRMATETNYTFIVIEAGSRSNFLLEIPVVGPLLFGSLFDWQYETVPQENACYAMRDKKCRLPQGKILGGSTKLNNMIHHRGNLSHYSNWFHGEYTIETIRKQFEYIESKMLNIETIQYESKLSSVILNAAEELGFKLKMIDGEFNEGFTTSMLWQKNGKRWSTSDLLDMQKHVLANVIVERIMIENNEAKGVVYSDKGFKKSIKARKGVILSAGALNSPKILQLSGIGPEDLLKTLQVDVIQDLPVGKNLQDHISTGLDLVLFNKSLSISANDILNPIHIFDYFLNGKGPLTTPGCEVVGFLSTENNGIPDLQFMVLPVGISSDRGSHLRKSLGIKDEVWHQYFVPTFDRNTASILPIILHPKSKGEVFITSTDPKKPLAINPGYLSRKEDRDLLIKGLELVSKFVQTEAMKSLEAHLNPIPFPGCEHLKIFSNKYWNCYIQQFTLSSYHPVGTCSMGLTDSKNAVVDISFKVIGVNNLYVTDASVLPTLPSANINAAVSMMASMFFDINIVPNHVSKDNLVCFRRRFYDVVFKSWTSPMHFTDTI